MAYQFPEECDAFAASIEQVRPLLLNMGNNNDNNLQKDWNNIRGGKGNHYSHGIMYDVIDIDTSHLLLR